jgi:hypothetical protein
MKTLNSYLGLISPSYSCITVQDIISGRVISQLLNPRSRENLVGDPQ